MSAVALAGRNPVPVPFHGLGVAGSAVVELDAVANVEGVGHAVIRHVVGFGNVA